ncbi:hypothetical protein KVR01_011746 [Diaporthe batatas]|uniref:glucose-induced degradation complex subunit VID30 n=1 Tax=Diaporthe batatas TaxID=748121 RepID=UPI001D049BC6|nr:glucose-induced degradation complex subunit VID30 [Diaporthe batatas]KAG8158624.1 hypothetical protein KVR01_011746 [Diaporthe batatas]
MTSPFQNSPNPQNTRQSSFLPAPLYPRSSHASVAAATSPRASPAAHGSTRAGPGSFDHILNPVDPDWDSRHPSHPSHHESSTAAMTQNGSTMDRAGGPGGLYPTRSLSHSQQLPYSSRAFDMFMSRTPLDSLPSVDILATGRPSPAAASPSPRASSIPRPSYLQGSHYLARLEHQARQRTLHAQRQRRDSHEKNGASLPGDKTASQQHHHQHQHLGIARDVVERTPPHEDDDLVDSLPSRWSNVKEDRAAGLEVLSDGLEVKYTGPRDPNERDHEARAIRADQPMPVRCGLYYYEVTILGRKHNDTLIGVGFSSKSASLNRAPGWEPESWGYHGDDGHCFQAQNAGKQYGPTFGYGDVIGCGVNFRTGTAFFTKNGHYLGIAFREVKGKLYPSVGLKKTGEHIRVNFGQTPFLFDIDSVMKKEIRQLEKEIEQADTTKLAPPLSETELIQQLVLQFLQHDGYVDTARAFAQEIQSEKQALCLDPNEEIPGIDIKDDEDANNRQSIRRAILEGDIDKALDRTKASYPQVLEVNEHVHFRLRCRKFIEMIRREAETNLVGAGGPKGTAHISGKNGHRQPPAVEDMELDEEMEDMDGAHDQQDLTEDALRYGQTLQHEYRDDDRTEVHQALNEIFSLMAYENPLKEPKVAHLLDRKGRVAVAEELNSAILQSLGKSSRAALENMYAQTSVLLDDLAETGGPGAFVTLQNIIDEIDTPRQGF